jgi:GTP cyclohydrolase II
VLNIFVRIQEVTLRVNDYPNIRIRDAVGIPLLKTDGGLVPVLNTFEGLDKEHFAMVFGDMAETPLVRIHSECMTGDVFGSALCDCGPQLNEAISKMTKSGGVLIYLRQEGRGIGLNNKIAAYRLQRQGLDTFEANIDLGFEEDLRDFSVAAIMLQLLSVNQCILLSNNPDKAQQLRDAGIDVVEIVNTATYMNDQNTEYLKAKKKRSHTLNLV